MSVIEEPKPKTVDEGWHPDPLSKHKLRFFDGTDWTEHVTHHGPTPCESCGPGTGE